MDTNFNAALYQEEMLSLVNTAIKKLKAEHPDYTVFTKPDNGLCLWGKRRPL